MADIGDELGLDPVRHLRLDPRGTLRQFRAVPKQRVSEVQGILGQKRSHGPCFRGHRTGMGSTEIVCSGEVCARHAADCHRIGVHGV